MIIDYWEKKGSTISHNGIVEVAQVSQTEMRDPAALGKRAIARADIRPSNDLVGKGNKEQGHPAYAFGHEGPDVQEEVCEMRRVVDGNQTGKASVVEIQLFSWAVVNVQLSCLKSYPLKTEETEETEQ